MKSKLIYHQVHHTVLIIRVLYIGSSLDEVVDEDAVIVPITDIGLSDEDSLVLQRSVNPMEECDDFGI